MPPRSTRRPGPFEIEPRGESGELQHRGIRATIARAAPPRRLVRHSLFAGYGYPYDSPMNDPFTASLMVFTPASPSAPAPVSSRSGCDIIDPLPSKRRRGFATQITD